MDDFMPPTQPIKPSGIPRISSNSDLKQKISSRKEINENEKDTQNHMCSKSQNPKKQSVTKHFMSPTISAASKATTPSKKILAERNDISGSIFSHSLKRFQNVDSSSNLDLDDFQDNSSNQMTPLSPKSSELEASYDPLTNYLSPRPKFLRYNPNRRTEILLRRENEVKQFGKNGLGVNRSASKEPEKLVEEEEETQSDVSSSQEDVSSSGTEESEQKQTLESEKCDESEEEDDEEVEEVEEEEGKKGWWNFSKVLQFLLILSFVAFSTFYVSFMNSPNPPPPVQTILDLKQGYQRFQNSLSQSVLDNFVLWGTNKEFLMEEITERGNVEGIKGEDMGEIQLEIPNEFIDQMDGISELNEPGKNLGLMEVSERVEDEEIKEDEVVSGKELEKTEDILVDEIFEVNGAEALDISELVQVSEDQIVDVSVDEEDEADEKLGTSEMEVNSEKEENLEITEAESDPQMAKLLIEEVNDEVIVQEAEMLEGRNVETEFSSEVAEEVSEPSEVLQTQVTNDNERSEISTISEKELISEKQQIESDEVVSSIAELPIVISICAAILASLVLGFLGLKRRKSIAENVSPTVEPTFEYRVPKKRDTTIDEIIEKANKLCLPEKEEAESYTNPSSVLHSAGNVSKDLYQSRLQPTVELLGEFVMEESVSSLKNCSLVKSRTIDGGEESKFSVSISEKWRGRRMSPDDSQEYPSQSEFSAADSPSYGSFTTQEKIVTKKGTRDGEEILKIITTPVRRSSRIRSKSVMSP